MVTAVISRQEAGWMCGIADDHFKIGETISIYQAFEVSF
jgi:hypothetical protein